MRRERGEGTGSNNTLFNVKKPFWYKKTPGGRRNPSSPIGGEKEKERQLIAAAGWDGQASLPVPPSYHGNALRVTVEVRGGAAAPWGLAPPAVRMLQRSHQGVIGDGAKLIGEGAVEDQDVNDKQPLADGSQMLQEEALVDKEDAT